MDGDLTFGVAIKSTGDGSVVADAKASQEALQNLDASVKNHAASAKETAEYIMGMSVAESNAKDKAWALANGYKEAGGVMVKASKEVADHVHVNSLAMRESLVLVREAARGNFSRMAGSASLLAQSLGGLPFLLNPIVLGVAGVGAAVAGGIYWWDKYGESLQDIHAKLDSVADDGLQNLENKIALQNQTLSRQVAMSQKTGLTGLSDAEANRLGVLNLEIEVYTKRVSHAKQGTDEYAESTRHLAEYQASYNKLVAELADRQSLQEQKKGTSGKSTKKLLDETQHFDTQLVESGKDAFSRRLDDWIAMQQKMVTAGIYYGKVREDHEAAYTAFVNAENLKLNTAAEKAAKKQQDNEARHYAVRLANEQSYFSHLSAIDGTASKTAAARENTRYKTEMAGWTKRHELAKQNKDYSLQEEEAYQAAKGAIIKGHHDRQMSEGQAAFEQQLATAGTQYRVAFEMDKAYREEQAVVAGWKAVQDAYAWGTTWGGPIGGAASAAVALAATAANVAAINGAHFGGGTGMNGAGGGSGGAPLTTPSPLAPAASAKPAPTGVAAQAPQQINLTIVGAKSNPDAPLISYNTMVEDFIPLINKAADNGHKIRVTVTSG